MKDEALSFLPCYLSDHKGFWGSIKTSAEDFVVTEIDISGQPVTKPPNSNTDDEATKALTDTVELQAKDDLNIDLLSVTTVSKTNEVTDVKGDGSLSVDCFDLNVILDSSVNEALKSFVSKMLVRDERQDLEMSLGTFPDKPQRAAVHRAVRHTYPFLMTITINQAEICVKEDPDFRQLAKLVSEEEADDFFRFVDAKVPGSQFTFLPDQSKEHRTSVHHFVSRRFGKLLETKSFTEGERTAITVRLREKGGRPSKKRSAEDCEEKVKTYTAFTLRKENLETLEAISYMAAVLGVLPSDFTYAGIKDKRAITYQSMVVKKISPERLSVKAADFERRGIQVSHIRAASEPLRLGRLQGNHFDLVVRDLRPHGKCSSSDLEVLVKKAVENVKARGFVNYYGPQRFGSGQNVQADQVGLALLKEDMNTAVKLFLSPEEGEDLQNKAKRHFLLTGNAKESLALMPAYKARERLMLRALHRYGSGSEGCEQAWLSLPHAMRIFYLHAYCSRLWNEAVCFRLLNLGPRPVQGDLVCVGPREDSRSEEGADVTQVHVVTAIEERDNAFSLDQDCTAEALMSKVPSPSTVLQVLPISAAHCSFADGSNAEVVLPMPGNSIKYPENDLGSWYRDRLARDGLGACRFRITALKLNVPGCYRPLLARPRNVNYILQAGEEPQVASSMALAFDLDSSCYATVCLREIMKCDPSTLKS